MDAFGFEGSYSIPGNTGTKPTRKFKTFEFYEMKMLEPVIVEILKNKCNAFVYGVGMNPYSMQRCYAGWINLKNEMSQEQVKKMLGKRTVHLTIIPYYDSERVIKSLTELITSKPE